MSVASAIGRPLFRLDEALGWMLDGLASLTVERMLLVNVYGLVLAEPLDACHDLLLWDNSAMDGFVVRAGETVVAAYELFVRLAVVGEAAVGCAATQPVEPGTVLRILTGVSLLAGADAVVPIEDIDMLLGMFELFVTVGLHRPVEVGVHVRWRVSDLYAGMCLLDEGMLIGAVELAIAVAGGHGELAVYRRLVLVVLATGDELMLFGAPLGEAQIPDSNSVGLVVQVQAAGVTVYLLGIVGDRFDDVVVRLCEGILYADVMVVSGGVSVGVYDVVKDAFSTLGMLELWRIAVQLGKSLAFARVWRSAGLAAAGSGGAGLSVLLFGLSGNPVSSFVIFELFVWPVLARLAGACDLLACAMLCARLVEAVTKSFGRRAFLRVRFEQVDGVWRALLVGGQGSHVLSVLAVVDGLAVVFEEVDGLVAGAEVDVIMLRGALG